MHGCLSWNEDVNPYEVLQLEQGWKATQTEIKKAYRDLARVKHPDKNPNAPVEEFHLIQSAYEILSDDAARAAFDNLFKAREAHEARWRQQSEKRRRMREDLERKEAASTKTERSEAAAQAALRQELDRLREKLEREHKAKLQQQTSRETLTSQDCSSLIKLKWEDAEKAWTEGRVRRILSAWVEVKTVVMKRKKGGGCSAVAELSSPGDVNRLVSAGAALISGDADGVDNEAALLLSFTLIPFAASTVQTTTASEVPLREEEVLEKMRRAAAGH